MKKITLLTLLLLATFGASTFAQNQKKQGSQKTAEERTEMITKKLSTELTLGADQQTQVKAIILEREKLRDAGKLTKDEQERYIGEINNVLSKEQQDKWIILREEAKEKHKAQKASQNKAKVDEKTIE